MALVGHVLREGDLIFSFREGEQDRRTIVHIHGVLGF